MKLCSDQPTSHEQCLIAVKCIWRSWRSAFFAVNEFCTFNLYMFLIITSWMFLSFCQADPHRSSFQFLKNQLDHQTHFSGFPFWFNGKLFWQGLLLPLHWENWGLLPFQLWLHRKRNHNLWTFLCLHHIGPLLQPHFRTLEMLLSNFQMWLTRLGCQQRVCVRFLDIMAPSL